MTFAAVALAYIWRANWYVIPADKIDVDAHNTRHFETYGADAPGFNQAVLKGVDRVQSTAMDGGGYFIGVHAVPAEAPVGYPLQLLGAPLLAPPRSTSYCSGSSYSAFIEALNEILGNARQRLRPDQLEALRMQEPDGSRREDGVKMWGLWNEDGPGTEVSLVEYARMGSRIRPEEARPGDFMNIAWKSGLGHSVVFLAWTTDAKGRPAIAYWSSQPGTHGFGDQVSPVSSVVSVVAVRLTDPEAIFRLDPTRQVVGHVVGDPVALPAPK